MQSYLTPEEAAQHLKVSADEITTLITGGKLKSIRIGNYLRIPENEFESLLVTCAAVAPVNNHERATTSDNALPLPAGSRWCSTRSGRAQFRVSGSVTRGAEVAWPNVLSDQVSQAVHGCAAGSLSGPGSAGWGQIR
ncbi:MAG: helix-turn-helix domain-containing protein [Bryobacterales bacterium]|nr:helix-turn-helix domain-containing protein [Bryobacterales bacterium]